MAPAVQTTVSQAEEVDCEWGAEEACNNYKAISNCYDFHTYCNRYSTLRMLGDVTGLAVLDLPSGPGHYARRLLQGGARVVTSVDIDANFLANAKDNVRDVAIGSSWNGIVANACEPAQYSGGPFDLLRANFLLENFQRVSDMTACARNMFNNLRPGGRYVGLWAPGAHLPGDRQVVLETVGMDTSDVRGMQSGDVCTIKYTRVSPVGTYKWYLRAEDELRDCLENAGFVNVRFERLRVDPVYAGNDDLHRFVCHVGNRNITALRPAC
jgi:toxoflavin synthase